MLRTSREAWNHDSGRLEPPWDPALLSGRLGRAEACVQAGEENDGYPESQMWKIRPLLHAAGAAGVVQLLGAAASPWQSGCCLDLAKTTFLRSYKGRPRRFGEADRLLKGGQFDCSRFLRG